MKYETLENRAEERWTTVRHLVWQGWAEDEEITIHDSLRGQAVDSGRAFIDTDGGLWFEADPEACVEEGTHVPRWHPAEFFGWGYCTRCGAQGITMEAEDEATDPA